MISIPVWSLKQLARKMHPSLPRPAIFHGEQERLVFSTYLYKRNLICLLQCFLCFVPPMSRNYSSSVCLCSKQQITIALVLSSGQPNVCFLFRRMHIAAPLHCPHSLIVFASVCPLLFIEDKTAGVQRSSLEVYRTLPAAKRCHHCQEFNKEPSVTSAGPGFVSRQEAVTRVRIPVIGRRDFFFNPPFFLAMFNECQLLKPIIAHS